MKNLLLSLLFILPFLGFAADNNTITVSQAQPQFTITLPGNATTGYSWLLTTYNSQVIKAVSSSYQANKHPAGMVGVPGNFIFNFEVLSAAFNTPQTTQLTFVYAHPWEVNKTIAQTQQYTVKIVK
jgi:predicted secreted protein